MFSLNDGVRLFILDDAGLTIGVLMRGMFPCLSM